MTTTIMTGVYTPLGLPAKLTHLMLQAYDQAVTVHLKLLAGDSAKLNVIEAIVKQWIALADEVSLIYMLGHDETSDYTKRFEQVLAHSQRVENKKLALLISELVIKNTKWAMRTYLYKQAEAKTHDRNDELLMKAE